MPRFTAPNGSQVNVDDELADRLRAKGGYTELKEMADKASKGPKGKPEEQDSDGQPKASGSTAEWAAYAASLGVDVPEGTKRDDIKALVEAHKAAAQGE